MFLPDSEIDTFVEQYISDPPSRKSLLGSLRNDAGRLFLNVPVYGAARRVALFLKDGPFSVYYEFEKGLSSYLHPFLTRIKGTIITDILINSHFNRKYGAYRKKAEGVLRRKGGPTFESLGEIVPAMVAGDGHYMAVKFSDIILAGRFNELHQVFRPIEHTVMNMKKSLGPDEEKNILNVRRMYERYLKSGPRADGARCVMRMEWDDELKKYAPYLREEGAHRESPQSPRGQSATGIPGPTSRDEEAGEEGAAAGTEDAGERVHDEGPKPTDERILKKYAMVLKQNFIDKLAPDDEEKLVAILDSVYGKNKNKFSEEDALAILEGLAEIWLADDSLDEWKCEVIRSYLAARLEGALYIMPASGDDVEVERPEIMVDEEGAAAFSRAAGDDGDMEVLESGDLYLAEDDGASSGDGGTFDTGEPEEEPAGTGVAAEVSRGSSPDHFQDEAGSFEISGRSHSEPGTFAVSEKNTDELGAFDIADEEGPDQGRGFEIREQAAGLQEVEGAVVPGDGGEAGNTAFPVQEPRGAEEQGYTIAAAVEQYTDTLERIRGAGEKELEKALALMDSGMGEEASLKDAFRIHERMLLDEHRFAVAEKCAGSDTFFGDLMGHLAQVARILSSQELIVYVEELIDAIEQDAAVMEEHPDVIPRLIAYRDSIVEDPAELLQEINARLAEIQHECGDDPERGVVRQCGYLQDCLEEERFEPVKRTILRIMENLLLKDDPDAVKRLLNAGPPHRETVLRLIQEETGMDSLNLRAFSARQREREKVSGFLIKTTAGEQERDAITMILHDEEAPSSLRFFIQEADGSSIFEEAFLKITKSADFTYKDKILLLERWLKPRAEAEGWLEEGRREKIARIDRMVLYYSGFLGKDDEVRKAVGKRAAGEPAGAESGKRNAATEQGTGTKADIADEEEIAADDPAFVQLVKIIKSFADVIEDAEPLLRQFSDMVQEEHREALEGLIAKYRGSHRELLDRTAAMISSGEPDEELIERLNTASSMMQYIWSRKVMERRNASDLAEVFKGFKDNKEYYSRIERIMKIIKINNRDDLLKTTVDRELKLVRDIEANLTPDDLKGLWRKTVNRKHKDRIRLFRELLDIPRERG